MLPCNSYFSIRHTWLDSIFERLNIFIDLFLKSSRFLASINLGLVLPLIALSIPSSALEGEFKRLDNLQKVSFTSDGDWLVDWSNKSFSRGVYEELGCWASDDEDGNRGDHMFYTADGEECCMRVRKVGSKMLLNHIAGYESKICTGGVYLKMGK